MSLPTTAAERKAIPIITGLFDYFPDACAAVAELSRIGNEQHNPGQPLHWAREKSTDHADCIGRHLIERGTLDTDGQRHSAKVAWRALALLQTEIEAARTPSITTTSRGLDNPERTRWGFTVGEVVNTKYSRPNEQPGCVIGFGDAHVLVRWEHWKGAFSSSTASRWRPGELRHGA